MPKSDGVSPSLSSQPNPSNTKGELQVELLEEILAQLKMLNMQISFMTDESSCHC